MITTLYHGSSKFNPAGGYAGGKPSNFQYGVGLYTTNSYRWASLYGRKVYALTVDLDDSKAAHNVDIPYQYCQGWVDGFCSKKLAKLFKLEFSGRETLNAERFEIFLHWNIRSFTKLAVPLAKFFTFHNVQYCIETGAYSGSLVRIFDFDCLKGYTCDPKDIKALGYDDTDIPDEVSRYKKYKINVA